MDRLITALPPQPGLPELLTQDKLCFCIWDHKKSLTIFSDGWIHQTIQEKTILQMLAIDYSMSVSNELNKYINKT